MPRRAITIELEEATYQRLEATARTAGQSASEFAAHALSHEMNIIAEIEEGIREADAGEFATEEEVEAVFRRFIK